MIGYWGYLQFEVNHDWWQYPANAERTAEGRYDTSYPANSQDRPKLTFQGAEVDTFTFTMHLDQRFNSNIKDLLAEIVVWVNTGVAAPLVIGTKAYGHNKWVCTKAVERNIEILRGGIIASADVDVTLREY